MTRIAFITVCTVFLTGSSINGAGIQIKSNESKEDVTEAPVLVCSDNEIQDNCPVDCPSDFCPKSKYEDQSACPKPIKCPPPACKCQFNYRRADNGTCIATRDCPPFECNGENEVYDPCPPYCPGQNCSQATPDGKCHIFGFIGIVLSCEPACRCKMYYWRLNGTCVPYSQCSNQNNSIDTTTVRTATALTIGREETVANMPEPNTNSNYKEPEITESIKESIDSSRRNCNDKDNNNSDESDCGCDETDINVCECVRNPNCGSKDSKSIDFSNRDYNDKDSNNSDESDCGCDEIDINVCECVRNPDCGCKDSKSIDSSNRDCNDKDNNSDESDCGCDETDINVCECVRDPDCGCKNSKSVDSRSRDYSHKDNNNSDESDCGCDETDINVCECIQDPDCGCKNSKSVDSRITDCNDKDNSNKSNCKTDDCGYEDSKNRDPRDCDNDAANRGAPPLDSDCKETESDILIPEELPVCKFDENDNESESNQDESDCETTLQSPPTCANNEILDDCPVDCPSDYCPKSRYDDQSTCPRPENCLPAACKCRFNYRKAENGTCIPIENCPPFECNGLHEQYNACPAYCPGESCTNATPDGECHAIGNILVAVTCKPACTCEKTYWRLKGNCVTYAECRECLNGNSTNGTFSITNCE